MISIFYFYVFNMNKSSKYLIRFAAYCWSSNRSKIIWCGDYRQTDLRKSGDKTGILKFFDIAHHMNAFTRVEFTADDIVRSSLVKDYILAKLQYEDNVINN